MSNKSQTRAALAAHHPKVTAALAVVEQRRRPALENEDRLSGANADLHKLEVDQEKAKAAEAEAVVSGVKDLRKYVEAIDKHAAAIERQHRIVVAIKGRDAELRANVNEAVQAANAVSAETAPLINAVLLEEGLSAVERMKAAYAVLGDAAAAVDGIKAVLHKRGADAEGEKIGAAVRAIRRPEPRDDVQKYLDFAARLASDAGAQVEARS